VNGMPGGKVALDPDGSHEAGAPLSGWNLGSVDARVRLDAWRWVMVDWLRLFGPSERSAGPWSLAKKAPVLASAMAAPSTAKTSRLLWHCR